MYFNENDAKKADEYLKGKGFLSNILIITNLGKIDKDFPKKDLPIIDMANFIKYKEKHGVKIRIEQVPIDGIINYIWTVE